MGGFLVLTGLQSCKHEPITPDNPATGTNSSQNTGTSASTDGATLYANNCAGCHGALASSAKLGASVTQIQNGISSVSGMKSLSSLTVAQIQAISDALNGNTTSTSTSTSSDGATLYANNCAGCHGVLASSAKLGATLNRIQNAISSVSNMNSLSKLTTAQVQAIADALAATPMPTDGASLYSINCSSCHGALAKSSVGSSSVSEIQNAIKNKSRMKYLSTLTLAQIQAISGALAGIKGGDD
jgi:mono/diheme cytochrome c family protein